MLKLMGKQKKGIIKRVLKNKINPKLMGPLERKEALKLILEELKLPTEMEILELDKIENLLKRRISGYRHNRDIKLKELNNYANTTFKVFNGIAISLGLFGLTTNWISGYPVNTVPSTLPQLVSLLIFGNSLIYTYKNILSILIKRQLKKEHFLGAIRTERDAEEIVSFMKELTMRK